MRITSGGNLLINQPTAKTNYFGGVTTPMLQASSLAGGTPSAAAIVATRWGNSAGASAFISAKSRGTAIGTQGAVSNGDNLGQLSFQGDDGTNFVQSALVLGACDSAVSTGIVPGRLLFSTMSTAGSLTERMRIDSSGNVGIANTVASTIGTANGWPGLVVGSGTGAWGTTIYSGATSNGGLAFANGTTTTATYNGYVSYNHNTNAMTFATNGGSERMRIDSGGKVGIGLTSYSLPLSVVADANGQNIQINGRTGDDFGQIFFRNFGGANNLARIASDSNAGLIFGTGSQTAPTVPTERMRIDSSGNVGIGTSSPSGKFNVGGGRSNFGANSEIYSIGVGYTQARVNSGQTYYIGASDSATPDLIFSNSAGTERFRFGSAGQLGIGGANYGTSGQVLTSGGSGAAPSWAAVSSPGISQVVQTVKSDTFTMSSTTFTDITGLSVTITPSSSSSKILVLAHVNTVGTTLTSSSGIRLVRGSTVIGVGDASGSRVSTSGGSNYGNYGVTITGDSIMFLDSPATTSATTYKIQIQAYASTAYVNRSQVDNNDPAYYRSISTITVMEVKP
jgi:hypothetical protein